MCGGCLGHSLLATRSCFRCWLVLRAQVAAADLGQELDAVRAKAEQLEANLLDAETLSEQLRVSVCLCA